MVARALTDPFTVKSDFARENAEVVAQAASLGYITTIRPDGGYGRMWLVTVKGGRFIEQQKETSHA